MAIDIILFFAVFLSILILIVYLVRKKRTKKQADFFNPEDPVSRIFRHFDDI